MTHDITITKLRHRLDRWSARRRTGRELRALSEQSLDDIGMNRADIDTLIARM